MLPKSLLRIKTYKFFLLYCIIYFLILIFELNILYSESNYYYSFKHIYSTEEVSKIIKADKLNEWINYVIVPVYILGISFITALLLEIFKFLFEIAIPFKKLFKIAIYAHIVYVISYFLNVLIRHFTAFNLINGEKNYFSLVTYIEKDFPLLIINFLRVFDLRSVFYILFLSYVIKYYGNIKYKKSVLFVSITIFTSIIFYVLVMSIFEILII